MEVMPDVPHVPNEKGTCGCIRKCPKVARPKRFELLTYRFVAWRSIQLSYGRVRKLFNPDRSGCQEKILRYAIPRQER